MEFKLRTTTEETQATSLDLKLDTESCTPAPVTSVRLLFNSNVCGCDKGGGHEGTVLWGDIEGKPSCILSCDTLLQFVRSNQYIRAVADTDTIDLTVAPNGTLSAVLKDVTVEQVAGAADKVVKVSIDAKGRVVNMEEIDIAISSLQVSHGGMTLKQFLDSLVADGGDKHYEHRQTLPSATWVFEHNLGKVPSITVTDVAGEVIIGYGRTTNNLNVTTLTFSEAISGSAWAN